MKIALASAKVIDKDIDFNINSMLEAIQDCSGQADMILFGEAVLQGFNSLCWGYEKDKEMAVALNDPPIRRMQEAAKEYGFAVSFGYIERVEESLYSSQIVIDSTGGIIHNYHRVSEGWKYYWLTDGHYREGDAFETFSFKGRQFAIGLCGNLWAEGRPEEMKALHADVILWPVCCGYDIDEWNTQAKFEYAEQAALCGERVLFVDPTYITDAAERTTSAAIYFKNGKIEAELPVGESGILIVEISDIPDLDREIFI